MVEVFPETQHAKKSMFVLQKKNDIHISIELH
jgi:hypothetical protein